MHIQLHDGHSSIYLKRSCIIIAARLGVLELPQPALVFVRAARRRGALHVLRIQIFEVLPCKRGRLMHLAVGSPVLEHTGAYPFPHLTPHNVASAAM